MSLNNEIPVVKLKGTPRQRGQIYGETRKTEILNHIDHWKTYLEVSTKMDPDIYISDFLENTNLLNAVRQWTPKLLEEVEGIAEGTGIDFKTIFALQLPDEEWWYQQEKKGRGLCEFDNVVDHCSTIGIFNQLGVPNYVAQNLDVPGYYDGHQVILHIVELESDREEVVFSVDGMIALAGMNNRGIGICCNALLQLNHSKDGLPVAFVHRGVLSRESLVDATEFIHSIKHASGQNYFIGDSERVVGLECSANKVTPLMPKQNTSILCHTNHPLKNNDINLMSNIKKSGTDQHNPVGTLSNSEVRLNTLAGRLSCDSEPFDVEKIKSILSSHDSPENPICRHKTTETGSMTLSCMIVELTSSPTMYISSGPPCSSVLSRYKF